MPLPDRYRWGQGLKEGVRGRGLKEGIGDQGSGVRKRNIVFTAKSVKTMITQIKNTDSRGPLFALETILRDRMLFISKLLLCLLRSRAS